MPVLRTGTSLPSEAIITARGGGTYHFSYDRDDQQNFADTANVALLAQMGGKSDLVRLSFAAESFLAPYTGGAVDQQGLMVEGGIGR